MEDKRRCQSCGMPIGPGFYGTNASGSDNFEYCKFCFQKGGFTRPNLTLEEMIQMSVENMVTELGMDESKSKELAQSVIPHLKRWSLQTSNSTS